MREVQNGASLCHSDVPIFGRILGGVGGEIFQNSAVRLLGLRRRQQQVWHMPDAPRRHPAHRARDLQRGRRVPVDAERSGLLIAHEEILIVDSSEMERETDPVYFAT